ncbi:hypothetical protein AB6A40_002720 [Gnathostoma spinigerum]|uniref:Uncharacterized protein n=1 Tax=Gnathostoma spinigerum TaxID=75299 RepID=A0ABD6E8S0_9BILA
MSWLHEFKCAYVIFRSNGSVYDIINGLSDDIYQLSNCYSGIIGAEGSHLQGGDLSHDQCRVGRVGLNEQYTRLLMNASTGFYSLFKVSPLLHITSYFICCVDHPEKTSVFAVSLFPGKVHGTSNLVRFFIVFDRSFKIRRQFCILSPFSFSFLDDVSSSSICLKCTVINELHETSILICFIVRIGPVHKIAVRIF